MKLKKFIKFLSLSFSTIFILSCGENTGLGGEVDVEAPVISITSHHQNDYAAMSMVLEGDVSDNQEIVDIEVKYKYKDQHGIEVSGTKHTNTPNRKKGLWNCTIDFNEEDDNQEVEISVYAWDKNRNESSESFDTVTVLIDGKSPLLSNLNIKRVADFDGYLGPITNFLGENGKVANRNKSENKDSFQNENVKISCNVKEDFELKTALLDLYEVTYTESEGSYIYSKRLIKEGIPSSAINNFNPEFNVTQALLTEADPAFASGIHYFTPEIVVYDMAGNKSHSVENLVPRVFAWEAEYNEPKITISASMTGDKSAIKIPQETTIIIRTFDDDELNSYRWTLTKDDDPSKTRTGEEDLSLLNIRDHQFDIPTGITSRYSDILSDGDYTLNIKIIDQNHLMTGRRSCTLDYSIPVKITNADAATVNVTSPSYNSIPALTDKSRFTLSGEIIDNAEVSNIAVAWLRKTEDMDALQKKVIADFETFDFSRPVSKSTPIESADKKYLVWNIGKDSFSGSGTVTTLFSKEFNIFTDFMSAQSVLENEPKIFIIGVKDATGNITTEVHRTGAFTSIPKFKIETSPDNVTYTQMSQNTISAEPLKDIYIKITPTSDLDLNEFIVNGENKTSYVESGFVVPVTNPASDSRIVISYSATDKFLNANNGNFTIQFEKIPEITGILCKEENEILKKDSSITIQTTFDNTVKVTGSPTIELDCYKNNVKTGTFSCLYKRGSDTATLYFETAAIPENLEYDEIRIRKDDSEGKTGNWITLGSAAIMRSTITANLKDYSGSGNFRLTVDSKKPSLTSRTGQREGTTSNFSRKATDSSIVEITFSFSEPVTARNGNIKIFRKGSEDVAAPASHNWHIPAVISAQVFEKIWGASTNANRVVLSSSSTSMSISGKDAYGKTTLVAAGPYKMYTNGLELNRNPIYQYAVVNGNAVKTATVIAAAGTVMVPDLTTKYVLDYNFDTNDTSGTKKTLTMNDGSTNEVSVNDIRLALEAINYHKTEIPLSRLIFQDDRKSAVLQIKDSDFIDGIRDGVEYIMQIPTGAFSDDVHNNSNAIPDYAFTVGKTAKPVIRVNRWSTNSNSQLDPYNASSTAENYLKAGVKIDCETPGASIRYQVTDLTVDSDYGTTISNYQRNIYAPDIMPPSVGTAEQEETTITPTINNGSSLTGGAPAFDKTDYKKTINAASSYTSGTPFFVGSGNVAKGERIYIGSNAAAAGALSTELQQSSDNFEGAFKTVLHYNRMINGTAYNGNNFKVHACQTPEGVSYIAGWPLSMRQHFHHTSTEAGTEDCYKNAYKDTSLTDTEGNAIETDFKWVSWELLSDDFFTTTTVSWNFQVTIDTLVTYGSYVWGYNVNTWGMNLN